MRELSMNALDLASGGQEFTTKCWDVPGGSVCYSQGTGSTSMQFGGVTITVGRDGSLTTTGTSTTTHPA